MNTKSEVTSVCSLPQTEAAMFTYVFMSFMHASTQPVAPKHITAVPMPADQRALTTGTQVELPIGTGLPLIQMALLRLLPKPPCYIIIASWFAR